MRQSWRSSLRRYQLQRKKNLTQNSSLFKNKSTDMFIQSYYHEMKIKKTSNMIHRILSKPKKQQSVKSQRMVGRIKKQAKNQISQVKQIQDPSQQNQEQRYIVKSSYTRKSYDERELKKKYMQDKQLTGTFSGVNKFKRNPKDKMKISYYEYKQKSPNKDERKNQNLIKISCQYLNQETYPHMQLMNKVKSKSLIISQRQLIIQQEQDYNIHFPKLKEIQAAVHNYQPLTDYINLESMLSSSLYSREYKDDEKQSYFYFGELDSSRNKNGQGVFVTPNKLMEGKWKNNNLIKGALLKKNYIYVGDFHNNKKHGVGTFKSTRGQQYIGEWKNDKRQGFGRWKSSKNQSYVGNWVNGKAQGNGIYIQKDKSKYQGQFKQYLKHGKGKQIFPNGEQYHGHYFKGFQQGIGKYIWTNGMVYKGAFSKGSREGQGIVQLEKFFFFKGYFHDDKPHQQGQFYLHNGQIIKVNFEKGILVDSNLVQSRQLNFESESLLYQ